MRFWYWISRGLWQDIKSFYQRGTRGYSDVDVWDLGYYVSSFMPEAIRKLKSDNPSIVSAHPTGVKTRKEWDKMLEKMAKGFEAVNKIADILNLTPEKFKKLEKTKKEGMAIFAEWIEALWD